MQHSSSGSTAVTHKPTLPAILIVEDEGLLRWEMASELRDAGWTVIEAGSGEEALAHLRAAPWIDVDIVITDIHLGGQLSGWDVAEALRARKPTIPVIYASSNA